MNSNLLSWLLNVVKINVMIWRGGRLLLYGNPKGYEAAEHIYTKFEVHTQMISTFKNKESIWSMNPGENYKTSIVGPMGILVALVKRKIGQGYSKSWRFSGRPYIITFIFICISLAIETWTNHRRINWERFYFDRTQTVGKIIVLFLWGLTSTISIWRQSKLFWV